MSGTISFNPYQTTSPQNTFLLETQGYVEGLPYDDTVARLWLDRGILASTETIPMWGGQPIEEVTNVTGTGGDGMGGTIKRATSGATCTGFSTFLQQGHMVIVPGPSVPVTSINTSVGFFRLGTQQRLAVQLDPAAYTTIAGSPGAVDSYALYWNPTSHFVTLTTTGGNWALPTSLRLLSINNNSKIVSYNSTTGAVTWTSGAAAMLLI